MSKDYKPVDWKEPSTWWSIAIALLIAVGIPLAAINGKNESPTTKPVSTPASPVPAIDEKKCDSMLGNIGAISEGEVIYTDPQCSNRIGLFMGTSKDGSQVGVRRDSDGQLEMVDRDTITHNSYIKR